MVVLVVAPLLSGGALQRHKKHHPLQVIRSSLHHVPLLILRPEAARLRTPLLTYRRARHTGSLLPRPRSSLPPTYQQSRGGVRTLDPAVHRTWRVHQLEIVVILIVKTLMVVMEPPPSRQEHLKAAENLPHPPAALTLQHTRCQPVFCCGSHRNNPFITKIMHKHEKIVRQWPGARDNARAGVRGRMVD